MFEWCVLHFGIHNALFKSHITIKRRFPTATRMNVSVKALHNAMPSPWVPSNASFVSFRRLTLAEDDEDVLFILRWYWDNDEEARVQHMFYASTVHWPITNASTPLTVTFYWWQRSPTELRRRKFYSLCKFLLLRDLYDRYYWKVIGDIGAYFDRQMQLSLKSVYFPTAWCLCKCARLVSHCEIDVELSPPFVYPANKPCVWILPCGTDKGAVYCKKLLKTLLISVRCRTWSITN